MDAAVVQEILDYVTHQRLYVDYVQVAAVAVMLYDWVLTIHLEVKHVWLANWNYTKILFLLTRYLPIANGYFILRQQVFLGGTPEICKYTYPVASGLLMVSMFVAEVVLTVRTWALWYLDRRVGLLLLVLQLANLIEAAVRTPPYLKALQVKPALYPGFRGCFATSERSFPLSNFISLLLLESAFLVLMCISAFRAYRLGNNTRLTNVIHRDGILFYLYLLLMVVANLIVMRTLPPDFVNILLPLQGVLHSLFTTRIIINIRSQGHRMINELHTCDVPDTSDTTAETIRFQRDLEYDTTLTDRDREVLPDAYRPSGMTV